MLDNHGPQAFGGRVDRGDGTVALDGTAVCYTMAIDTGNGRTPGPG